MKLKPIADIKTSLEEHVEKLEKVIEQHNGGLDALRELIVRISDERRGLKATRGMVARSGKSTRTIDNILREQLFELQQVVARRDGIKAARQVMCHDHWELKSILAQLPEEAKGEEA